MLIAIFFLRLGCVLNSFPLAPSPIPFFLPVPLDEIQRVPDREETSVLCRGQKKIVEHGVDRYADEPDRKYLVSFYDGGVQYDAVVRNDNDQYDHSVVEQVLDISAVNVKIGALGAVCILYDLDAEHVDAEFGDSLVGKADPVVRQLVELFEERRFLAVFQA